MRSQVGEEVACDRDVGIGCACHRDNFAVEVFVFAGVMGFELQVLFRAEVTRLGKHGDRAVASMV